MPDLLSDYFQFHQRALSIRAERQQILASNIANADTPNFKARDIDFKAALATALSTSVTTSLATSVTTSVTTSLTTSTTAVAATSPSTSTATLHATHSAHLESLSVADNAALLYRIPRQDSIDGNTVELDMERAQFTDNALRYEAGITAVNGKIKDLLSVIQGQ